MGGAHETASYSFGGPTVSMAAYRKQVQKKLSSVVSSDPPANTPVVAADKEPISSTTDLFDGLIF